jgi:hypothetical protein
MSRSTPPPRHFEFITKPVARVSLGSGNLLPMYKRDFPALAERYESPYRQLPEAVPLALGFAPK